MVAESLESISCSLEFPYMARIDGFSYGARGSHSHSHSSSSQILTHSQLDASFSAARLDPIHPDGNSFILLESRSRQHLTHTTRLSSSSEAFNRSTPKKIGLERLSINEISASEKKLAMMQPCISLSPFSHSLPLGPKVVMRALSSSSSSTFFAEVCNPAFMLLLLLLPGGAIL